MTDIKLKGLVVFWVNVNPDTGQDTQTTLEMVREMNKPLLDQLKSEDGRYKFLFIPTFKEATRVEKIDFDEPFPRCRGGSLPFKISSKKKDESHSIKGIITMFINFSSEMEVDISETLDLIREINKEVLQETGDSAGYKAIIVPTTKEGSRIEKVDWDFPFPRIIPGSSPTDDDEEDEEDGDE